MQQPCDLTQRRWRGQTRCSEGRKPIFWRFSLRGSVKGWRSSSYWAYFAAQA